MTPHKQLLLHRPEDGVLGDCYRTAIACLLDMPPQDVPHHYGRADMTDAEVRGLMQVWLAGRGLIGVMIGFTGDMPTILRFMASANPGLYYMLSGTSPRGFPHVVIALDGAIIHDPHIDGCGLSGPDQNGTWWVEFFAPLFLRAQGVVDGAN